MEFIKNNTSYFNQKKVFLLTKNLVNYGGNQKTSVQLYNELLLNGYNVKVGCITKSDQLNCIDKNDIIKFNNVEQIIDESNNNYEYIITNKLDGVFDIAKSISKEMQQKHIFITHNSMDPVNNKIIDNYKYFNKILTINNYHTGLLYEKSVHNTITQYYNYNDSKYGKVNTRKEFKNNLVFISRLSNEKNINLLLEAFELFSTINPKIKLTIIGNGKYTNYDKYVNISNVNFIGRCEKDVIYNYLINSDYLILTSSTEGIPFVFLEAFSVGIPVITTNIIGCSELVKENETGFLFNLEQYNENKNIINNWDILDIADKHKEQNKQNLIKTLEKAFSIDINIWNKMSNNCYNYYNDNYDSNWCKKQNMINIKQKNKIAIICPKCESYFKDIFNYIDIVNTIEGYDNYDIIININSFDTFCNNMSILKGKAFINNNLNIINKIIARLYKLKKELSDNKINEIYDNMNSIYFNIPIKNKIQVNDIYYYL